MSKYFTPIAQSNPLQQHHLDLALAFDPDGEMNAVLKLTRSQWDLVFINPHCLDEICDYLATTIINAVYEKLCDMFGIQINDEVRAAFIEVGLDTPNITIRGPSTSAVWNIDSKEIDLLFDLLIAGGSPMISYSQICNRHALDANFPEVCESSSNDKVITNKEDFKAFKSPANFSYYPSFQFDYDAISGMTIKTRNSVIPSSEIMDLIDEDEEEIYEDIRSQYHRILVCALYEYLCAGLSIQMSDEVRMVFIREWMAGIGAKVVAQGVDLVISAEHLEILAKNLVDASIPLEIPQ